MNETVEEQIKRLEKQNSELQGRNTELVLQNRDLANHSNPALRHKFSVEILYHYNCGRCQKWWSIALDIMPAQMQYPLQLACPHCGACATVTLKEEL